MTTTSALELHDRTPQRVLAVVAHPDDLEYGAAALVARWTRAGAEVGYLLATRGEAGIDGVEPAEAARLRTEEQVASAAVVGVTTVEFLDHRDGTIELGLRLRQDIALAIRRPARHAAAVQPSRDVGTGPAELPGPPPRRSGRTRGHR